MAKATANQIARSIPKQAGASTIANMESRTDTPTVRAAVSASLKTGTATNFSGQYLFDRFVANDKTEVTKLGIVRQMVEQLELDRFKTVINEFVGVAVAYRDKVVNAEKEAGTYKKDDPSKEINFHNGRVKTAQNHQTVMRVVYGAMRFAPEQLAAQGFDDTTGYQVGAVNARNALKVAGIKWDGTKLLDKTQSEKRAQSKAEEKALSKVMEANPREADEPMHKYLSRVSGMVAAQVTKDKGEAEAKQIETLVRKVREMAGGLLDDVIERLLQAATEPVAETLEPKAAVEASKDATKH